MIVTRGIRSPCAPINIEVAQLPTWLHFRQFDCDAAAGDPPAHGRYLALYKWICVGGVSDPNGSRSHRRIIRRVMYDRVCEGRFQTEALHRQPLSRQNFVSISPARTFRRRPHTQP